MIKKIRRWMLENCYAFRWQFYPSLWPLWAKDKVLGDLYDPTTDHYLIIGPLQMRWSSIGKTVPKKTETIHDRFNRAVGELAEIELEKAVHSSVTTTRVEEIRPLTIDLMDDMIDKLWSMPRQPAGAVLSFDMSRAMTLFYGADIQPAIPTAGRYNGIRYQSHSMLPRDSWFTYDDNWQVLQYSNCQKFLAQSIANSLRPRTTALTQPNNPVK